MANFPTFAGQCTLRQRHQLPDRSGIYFVIDKSDRLLYIGQAKNLRDRWSGKSHHRYKQFARKGLDKITLGYILVSVSELDRLEKEYINEFNPVLNDSKVREYLPKKSPRFSELQRLLKLTSKPLFPSTKYTARDGKTILREPWDLFRGFVAGVYEQDLKVYIVIVCRQNMGSLLWKSFKHRTKKRFYIQTEYELIPGYCFDARKVVFVFVEFFTLGDEIFEQLYPHLSDCQLAGVTIKKLLDPSCLIPAIENLPSDEDKAVRDYLISIGDNLQPLPADFSLNEQTIW